MKSIPALLSMALIIALSSYAAMAELQSLRGDELTTPSIKPQRLTIIKQSGGFERSFKEQPPMVPHEVDKYPINLRANHCLSCHGKKTHQVKKSPLVSESHFINRSGEKLESIAPGRYFCTQCHAPQLNDRALVENDFKGRH